MIMTKEKETIWPELPLDKWEKTYDLLHLLTQIVGKIKLQFVAYKNHWWNITFFPTVRGFTTGIIPCGTRCFEMDFDFVDHKINIKIDDGTSDFIELKSGTVAQYYDEITFKLKQLEIAVNIWPVPVEMEYRQPFNTDNIYRPYDPEYAQKLHKIIVQVARIMEIFRSGFTGKASPVHFFWGAFDMAVTFFSGRPAPEHQAVPNVGKKVMVEAYNAELASFGFWPGKGFGEPAFYAYAYPEPNEYKNYKIAPAAAYYHKDMGEYILPYSAMIKENVPGEAVVEFFISAYRAAARSGYWDSGLCKY